MKKLFRYKSTLIYIIAVVIINALFSILPHYQLLGQRVSAADAIAGAIYIFRDFAQREIQHYIILAMLIAGLISYIFAEARIAEASIAAFVVGESIDWLIFTFTKKPLSQRLLWSSCISAPIDTYVFLFVYGHLNWLSFTVMNSAKIGGVLLLWIFWKLKNKNSRYISRLCPSGTRDTRADGDLR